MPFYTIIIVIILNCCVSTAHAIFSPKEDWQHSVWKDLEHYHDEMKKHGYINHNVELNSHVSTILKRLGADKNIEIYVLNFSEVNAFAVPNGRIYVNLGLIMLTTSESELASILAHELTHLKLEHSAKNRLDDRRRSKNQFWANSLGLGVGGFAVGVANQLGQSAFSVEQEREADIGMINLLKQSSYHPHAIPEIFRKTHNFLTDMGFEDEGYFKTHPSLLERAESAEKLLGDESSSALKSSNNDTAVIRNMAVTEYITWSLDNNLYSHLIFTLTHSQFVSYSDNAQVLFGLARAYYQRGYSKHESIKQWKKWKRNNIVIPKPKLADADEAINFYRALLVEQPNHVQGNYDLAVIYVETGKGDFKPLFKNFLKHASTDDQQRVFAQYYLQ